MATWEDKIQKERERVHDFSDVVSCALTSHTLRSEFDGEATGNVADAVGMKLEDTKAFMWTMHRVYFICWKDGYDCVGISSELRNPP